jgi:uncharacterized protein YndB with AHSA1/START domain
MTVVGSTKDTETLTFAIVAELAAPPARVWQLWSDPRQLERWWGPPTWPATFERHEVEVGGTSQYFMTGPEGEKARGWWRFVAVDEPSSLEFDDGFADEAGEPDPAMPVTRARVDLEEIATGTRMTITSRFATLEQMEQLVQMGMAEGMTLALGQMDAILAEG